LKAELQIPCCLLRVNVKRKWLIVV